MKVLLFGGTSEGRALAQRLDSAHIPVTVCVATEYGEELLPQGIACHVGRLDLAQMAAEMTAGGYTCVVDATHPYAAEVTKNIRGAAGKTHLPCYRLVREGAVDGDWLTAADMGEAAHLAGGLEGNILLTTGSKELDRFATLPLRTRCYPRVLPSVESLSRCLELGFPPPQIICMQGPFSEGLNAAILLQFNIKILVTKATGGAGGFWEKVAAARGAGCTLIVIDRPTEETGYSLEGLIKQLEEGGAV